MHCSSHAGSLRRQKRLPNTCIYFIVIYVIPNTLMRTGQGCYRRLPASHISRGKPVSCTEIRQTRATFSLFTRVFLRTRRLTPSKISWHAPGQIPLSSLIIYFDLILIVLPSFFLYFFLFFYWMSHRPRAKPDYFSVEGDKINGRDTCRTNRDKPLSFQTVSDSSILDW